LSFHVSFNQFISEFDAKNQAIHHPIHHAIFHIVVSFQAIFIISELHNQYAHSHTVAATTKSLSAFSFGSVMNSLKSSIFSQVQLMVCVITHSFSLLLAFLLLLPVFIAAHCPPAVRSDGMTVQFSHNE
jgi:hypothetical protein